VALTHRQLNRALLDRQLLLARTSVGVVDAVRQVVALQAQEPASPYIALWNRVVHFAPADLEVMAAVRNAFNPTGLCSPRKMLPTAGACGMETIERTGAGRKAM